jgi:7,8-dihydropterin-6-yl-methyl-4-(beta-D-ribofuranosyl)aminobenzene 5'-phosphate synthase
MKRRSFLKGLAAGSAGLALTNGVGSMTKSAYAKKDKEDFGEVKSIKVECVSETSWFDNATLG